VLRVQDANVYDGTFVLADFGIARVATDSFETPRAGLGTPYYMPPEAFDGVRSEQNDVWAAGVILFELLAGRLPFYHQNPWAMPGLLRGAAARPAREVHGAAGAAARAGSQRRAAPPRERCGARRGLPGHGCRSPGAGAGGDRER
jgi:serine/threonine protein kinase